jgi:hypothetical protein
MKKIKNKKAKLPETKHQGWFGQDIPIRPLSQSPLKLPGGLAVLLLIGITLALSFTGIGWGLPNDRPWNTDSIAGTKTVQMIPRLFASWRMADAQGKLYQDREGKPVIERYPRMQFLLTGTLYKPFMAHWEKHPIEMRHPRTGQMVRTPLDRERISTLIYLSRFVTALMAIGVILGIFATTRLLTRDSIVGLLAALVMAFSPIFNYFAHLGNLDIPVTFWFIWTGYWVVRALQSGRVLHFFLMGIFAGFVICTKDPSAGHLAGYALFMLAVIAMARYRRDKSFKQLALVFVEGRLWLALGAFLFVFLLMNNVLTDFTAFWARVQHWMAVKEDYSGSAGKQWRLFLSAIYCIRECCGVWMFGAIGISLLYCMWRYPLYAFWSVAAFVMFHLTITMGAYQVQPRYHLPSLACLSVVIGLASRDLLCAKSIPALLRVLPLVVFLGLEAVFAIGVSAEMAGESRIRAEGWIRDNLDKQKDSITFISPPSYMPRSQHEGFRIRYTHDIKITTEKSIQHHPKYLALAAKWYRDRLHFDQKFRKKLLKEEMGYQKIADFGPKFLPPGSRGIFYVASLYTRARSVLSPRVIIMERIKSDALVRP